MLLILDYICDWACEIYRESILNCLTGGGDGLYSCRLTPPGTDLSSQLSEVDVRDLQTTSSLRLQSPMMQTSDFLPDMCTVEPSSLNGTDIAALFHEVTVGSVNGDQSHNWQWWRKEQSQVLPWNQTATIRHSNQVEFSTVHLVIPEQPAMLQSCLSLLCPKLTVEEASARLLNMLQERSFVIKDQKGMGGYANQPVKKARHVRLLVYFRSGLRPEDWQITRNLLVIACSMPAMKLVAQIAGSKKDFLRLSHLTIPDNRMEELVRMIKESPKLIAGSDSVMLAMTRRPMFLFPVFDITVSAKFQWISSSQAKTELSADELSVFMSDVFNGPETPLPALSTQHMRKHLERLTVPSSDDEMGSSCLQHKLPRIDTAAIIVKKPSNGWPSSTPQFCLMVVDQRTSFNDNFRLGQLLQETIRQKAFYAAAKKDASFRKNDLMLFDKWARILKGELPSDTSLE